MPGTARTPEGCGRNRHCLPAPQHCLNFFPSHRDKVRCALPFYYPVRRRRLCFGLVSAQLTRHLCASSCPPTHAELHVALLARRFAPLPVLQDSPTAFATVCELRRTRCCITGTGTARMTRFKLLLAVFAHKREGECPDAVDPWKLDAPSNAGQVVATLPASQPGVGHRWQPNASCLVVPASPAAKFALSVRFHQAVVVFNHCCNG